ncbi:MAG: hypothetical protein ACRCW3_03860 [Metamycoplasmataceae bacterium]
MAKDLTGYTDEELDFMYGDTLFGAPEENTQNLLDCFYSHDNVQDFLRNEDARVPLFPTTVLMAKEYFRYAYDLDGLVIELNDLTALKARIHYLFVGKVVGPKLQMHWPVLKKHVPLADYNDTGISALTKTFGHTLAFVDGGYMLNLSCMSALTTHPNPVFSTEVAARANATQVINNVLDLFATKLKELPAEHLQRPTIMKTNLNELKTMHILESDQSFVLGILMQAIQNVSPDPTQKLILFLTKFGQKQETMLPIGALVDKKGVHSLTCHAACTITSKDPRVDLMWSRYGIQEVVGHRGNIFTSAAMPETANFQTNLDQYPITLDGQLLDIFRGPIKCTNITFVQLYATTPHVRANAFTHPVSRVITTCGMHNPKHTRMILQRARSYIDHMQDLARKTVCRTKARMEAVYLLKGNIPRNLEARDFYNQQAIYHLLENTPMLIPFKDNKHKLGLRHVIHPVTNYLTETLYTLLVECKSRGGFNNSWTAFQHELALEEMFFGRPHSPRSKQFSVSLGTNTTNPNSLSKQRGFLGLSAVGSASVGEDPPPLETWIADPLQRMRIHRIFPLTDALDAGPAVIGEALVKVLLCDLHERNDRISIETFKQSSVPFMCKLVGCRTTSALCKDLADRKGFNYPHTFGRAIELAQDAGHDVETCLQLGLSGFKFFPSIVYWDEKRHPKAKWNKIDYIELYRPTETPSAKATAAACLGDVCSAIEKRGLSYSANLVKYKEKGMPWMEQTIQRLHKHLQKDQLLTILTFVSCVGMIQNGDFVTFNNLSSLISELTVTQIQLQRMHILSPLILLHTPKVHRLHDSMQYKVANIVTEKKKKPTSTPATRPRSPSPDQSEVDRQEPDEQKQEQVIERVFTRTVPANFGRWTAEESALVTENPTLSHTDAYKAYLKFCQEKGLPVRTFAAFKRKRQRLS